MTAILVNWLRHLPSPVRSRLLAAPRLAVAAIAVARGGRRTQSKEGLAELVADALLAAQARPRPPDAPPAVLWGLAATDEAKAAARLADASGGGLVVAPVPLWPRGWRAGVSGEARIVRSRAWWLALAARAGLKPALELRSDGPFEIFVFLPAASRRSARRPARTAPREVLVRIRDPLTVANSFAWISASIALALDDLGVPVSIAPTPLAPSFEPERRARLESLLEPRGEAPKAESEIGWTHFFPQYRRELGGRFPLPLFAINYRFTHQEKAAFDPWMRGLVESHGPVAPISSFCRDVLADAGLSRDRLPVVPMGYTEGLSKALAGPLPGLRDVKLLHTTNSDDVERSGTDLALKAFSDAFGPGDSVSLIVRDYGSSSPATRAAAQRLAGRGYDVRYLAAFFAHDHLGAFLGAFDALLSPFRGEGFGIKLLDAMACGVPPICPLFGGPCDFVDGEVAFPVAHNLVPVRAGMDTRALLLGNEPVWAETRHDALVAALRFAYDNGPERARRGAAARERSLASFSWADTARRVVALAEGS